MFEYLWRKFWAFVHNCGLFVICKTCVRVLPPPGKFIQIFLLYRLILLFFLLWECSSSAKMTFPGADLILSCYLHWSVCNLTALPIGIGSAELTAAVTETRVDSRDSFNVLKRLSWSGISEIASTAQCLLTSCPSWSGSSRCPSALWSQWCACLGVDRPR